MTIDPAAVDAAIARIKSAVYSHGRDCSLVGIEPARLADLETIADACEHYRQQLAAVTARAERMRQSCVKASAELRHCYGKGSLSQHDKGLVSRAIKNLELSVN